MAADVCPVHGTEGGPLACTTCNPPETSPFMTPKEFVDTVNELKNTQAEKEAVDKGVQENLPYQDARWHRREARRLLIGKKGLTEDEKVQRMLRAKKHLEQSIEMTIVGEADEDAPGF